MVTFKNITLYIEAGIILAAESEQITLLDASGYSKTDIVVLVGNQ